MTFVAVYLRAVFQQLTTDFRSSKPYAFMQRSAAGTLGIASAGFFSNKAVTSSRVPDLSV